MPLAIFHDPRIWLGNHQLPETGDPELFEEIVGQRDFGTLGITIQRGGLFVFDFSNWPDYQNSYIERRRRQLEIINTYLLCFYSAIATRGLWFQDQRRVIPMMRAEHRNILGDSSGKGSYASVGLSDDFQRFIASFSKNALYPVSHRLQEKVIEISFELFSSLWNAHEEHVFTLADLLLGAHVTHFNLRFSESLIYSWHIIEALLNMKWQEHIGSGGKYFIDKDKQKKSISDTKHSYSAEIVIDTLSEFSFGIRKYQKSLHLIRTDRNNWMHELKPASITQSAMALRHAESFLRDWRKFHTTLPTTIPYTFVTGGEFIANQTRSKSLQIHEYAFYKNRIHGAGLKNELDQALGDHTTGFSTENSKIRVHFTEKATPEDVEIARQVIEAHDPAFISIDDKHLYQRGEYQFDSDRIRPFVVGGSGRHSDQATLTIELPHTTTTEITVQIEGVPNSERIVQLHNGTGTLKISSRKPGKILRVTVLDHPCDPFEIEVKPP